eukprot:6260559-Lingulodinium_polyedra.AAC.1
MRDIFHRQWNDALQGIKNASLHWVILLSSVVYNMNYGPWEGSAWWHKVQEGGRFYWDRAGPQDLLFQEVYPRLCRDGENGKPPQMTQEEMEEMCRSLPHSRMYEVKGPKAVRGRWFSWMTAAHWHDRHWHHRLLVLCAIGLQLGVWKKKLELPLFRPPFSQHRHKGATEGQKEEQEEAREAAGKAKKVAGSSKTSKPAQQDQEVSTAVSTSNKEIDRLRESCKNTLFFVAEVLSMREMQPLCRLIYTLCTPSYDAHTRDVKACKSQEGVLKWYLEAAKGAGGHMLGETAALLLDTPKLEWLGFRTTLPQAGGAAEGQAGQEEAAKAEEDLANRAWSLVLELLAARAGSLVWHTYFWPGQLALALSEEAQDQEMLQARLAEDWLAFQDASRQPTPAWRKHLKANPFHQTFLWELASHL